MKVTVCQLPRGSGIEASVWNALAEHVQAEQTDLLLLPQIPFFSVLTRGSRFDQSTWNAALDAHDEWETRLHALQGVTIMGTRPIDFGNERYEEGFVWSVADGFRSVHVKAQLQDDPGATEKAWYREGEPQYIPVRAGAASCGFLMGSELWVLEAVENYRHQQIDLLVTPRGQATRHASFEDWLAAGRNAARIAGAFQLASAATEASEGEMDGGWIIDPDGELLAATDFNHPFKSAQLELRRRL
jgi:N-carbamoylputrescine amidase